MPNEDVDWNAAVEKMQGYVNTYLALEKPTTKQKTALQIDLETLYRDLEAKGASMTQVTGVSGGLTDGTGVSQLLGSKIVKDLILDALLSLPVSLAVINVNDLSGAVAAPIAVGFAVGDSLIRVLYRAALRWAQS